MKVSSYYKIFIPLLFNLFSLSAKSQNVGISSSSSFTPDASAALDVSFTNKGLLIPRVALTATNTAGPVTAPAISLLVYNTTAAGTSPNNVIPGYYYWNGTAWVLLSTSSQPTGNWSTGGNAGTSYPSNYLGTSDNFGLHVKTNATHRLWIDTLGSVAIGNLPVFSSSRERFLVDAGSTSTNPTPAGAFNVISGKGYLDSYLQLNIQNYAATAAASSDIVASNDAGSETVNYINMGINSSANTSTGVLGGASTAYLYATGNDFSIGNGSASKSLLFFTSGTAATPAYAERMRIDPSGNIGIGTASPATKLHVFGANPLTLSGVVNGTNTAGDSLLTITSGLVRKLPLSAFATTTNFWSTSGNAGTTAGTNFIGTTDAVDMSFRANNVERLRIINGTSSTTGTNGDIVVGDATSGTLRSNKELVLRQDGDVYGQSSLRLRNRNGQNGAVFETTGGSANLVDFIFNTGSVASPISSNIRFETRSGSNKVSGNSTEWQFGQPDATNGGPTLIVGAAGTGSNSSIRIGNFGVGTVTPVSSLDVSGSVGAAITTASGAINLTAGNYYTVILTAATATVVTLPAASSCPRRIYVLVNQNVAKTTSLNYQPFSGPAVNTIAANSSMTLQSDGINWYRIQ